MPKKKIALITGITGQDGSYLSELLLKKGYKVHGLVRRVASEDKTQRLWRLKHLLDKINLHAGSLESYASIIKLLAKIKPNEIYHLGAQSYIDYAFKDEFSTLNTNINGTHYLLSALRDFHPKTKFYFAASSEMFGKVREIPQKETTPFYPRSTYGISKVAGFDLTRNYREAYNLFCCSGILFNHESPRRGFEFVTRKITDGVAKIKLGLAKKLTLGNLDAKRDWGFAGDFVEAMYTMVQQQDPGDYVICTGIQHSIRELLTHAFETAGINNWEQYVESDPRFKRPAEVHALHGSYSKAKKTLGWEPKTSFKDMVALMVTEDIKRLSNDIR